MGSTSAQFPTVRVLYATATGTAEDIARDIAQRFDICRISVAACCAVDDYPFGSLPAHSADGCLFVFVVATAGDGEPPACMTRFWSALRRADLPRNVLEGVTAAVFGLGDRSYAKFNAAARRLATRLADLGVSLVVPLGLGDEANPGGFDAALRPWTEALFSTVVPAYSAKSIPSPLPPPEPRVMYRLHPGAQPADSNRESGETALEQCGKWKAGQVQKTRRVSGTNTVSIVESVVCENRVITNPDALREEREVRHIELDCSRSEQGEEAFRAYRPGDVVNVMPRNRESAVEAFLKLAGLDGHATIGTQEGKDADVGGADFSRLNICLPCELSDFVAAQLDLTALPRRRFLERLAAFANDEQQRDKLIHFASPEGADDFIQYGYREKRTILMVLRDFPSARPPLNDLIDMIPHLRPRAFSIASSRQAHGLKVHICAAIVKYTTPLRFQRVGVCSSLWVSAKAGDIVPVFLEQGTLRFEENVPAILIGPGTGVAPMRSFVSSVSRSPTTRLLYFGCRHKEGDFLYQSEWDEAVASGRLTRIETAFSRDDVDKKVYVQDRMEQNAEELWRLLEGDAAGRVYVAGAAGDMPKAVRLVITKAACKVGGMNEQDAEKYVKRLEVRRRLQIECW